VAKEWGSDMSQTKVDQAGSAAGTGWTDRRVGDALTLAAGVLFLLVCTMLPLVGPAAAYGSGSPGASTAAHFAQNRAAFAVVLLVTLLVSGTATASKLIARRTSGGRLPWVSIGIDLACAALLIVFSAGLLTL
jgi:hypothetical protein